jgi:hypothetical protein
MRSGNRICPDRARSGAYRASKARTSEDSRRSPVYELYEFQPAPTPRRPDSRGPATAARPNAADLSMV